MAGAVAYIVAAVLAAFVPCTRDYTEQVEAGTAPGVCYETLDSAFAALSERREMMR